jgi:hypothetical protein
MNTLYYGDNLKILQDQNYSPDALLTVNMSLDIVKVLLIG